MLGKGKDKKIIAAITCLRDAENVGGSPELVSIHSRLLKGRASFEGILTKSMTSAMSISNLDLQVSDRVEELEGLSDNLLGGCFGFKSYFLRGCFGNEAGGSGA